MSDSGRTLLTRVASGWRIAGKGGARWLDDDVLETEGGPGLLWYADEAFDDFILRVEWRTTRPDDNSGVFIRCPPLTNDISPAIERGYEVQIDDQGLDPETGRRWSRMHVTGAIYKLAPARCVTSRGVALWNEFEIRAEARTITVVLNGELVSTLESASREPRGHIALQNHHQGSAVQFRNLRVLQLS